MHVMTQVDNGAWCPKWLDPNDTGKYRAKSMLSDNCCLVEDKLRGGGDWSRKGLNFEWPYFCQYLSELYQIFSSCVLCGYIINYKNSAHLHNLYHDYPEFHARQACFRGKTSLEKTT